MVHSSQLRSVCNMHQSLLLASWYRGSYIKAAGLLVT